MTQAPLVPRRSPAIVQGEPSNRLLATFTGTAHALAAMSSEVAHPGYAGQTYAPLVGVGDSAFIDRPGGDGWAVDRSWVVFVGVGSGIPSAIRGATTETVLAAAVGNLPR